MDDHLLLHLGLRSHHQICAEVAQEKTGVPGRQGEISGPTIRSERYESISNKWRLVMALSLPWVQRLGHFHILGGEQTLQHPMVQLPDHLLLLLTDRDQHQHLHASGQSNLQLRVRHHRGILLSLVSGS